MQLLGELRVGCSHTAAVLLLLQRGESLVWRRASVGSRPSEDGRKRPRAGRAAHPPAGTPSTHAPSPGDQQVRSAS